MNPSFPPMPVDDQHIHYAAAFVCSLMVTSINYQPSTIIPPHA